MGRHTTVIDAAREVVLAAQKHPYVTKVSLQKIIPVKNGQRSIKFSPINGGWRLTIRGVKSLQDVMIYTQAPEKVKQALLATFQA